MTEIDSLTSPINALWMKYGGLRSEYKMVRDRWLYFNSEYGRVVPLPKRGNSIFDLIDKELDVIDDLFEYFKGQRLKRSSLEMSIDGEVRLVEYRELSERIREMVDWLSLLKMSFYQRTVSVEIPHYSFGLPRSPERTIGDEQFYLAADRVAESYLRCLKVPNLQWDGFITFEPMLSFWGSMGPGVFISPTIPVYHIIMPDHYKYLVTSSLILAHELGHPALDGNYYMPKIEGYVFAINIDKPIDRIRRALVPYIMDGVRREMGDEGPFSGEGESGSTREECRKCGIPFKLLGKNEWLDQILTDIIAFRIGGQTTIEVFLDEILNLFDFLTISIDSERETPVRVEGVGTSLSLKLDLLSRFTAALRFIKSTYPRNRDWVDGKLELIDAWGKRSAETIEEHFERFARRYPQEGPISLEEREIDLKCCSSFGKSFSKALVETGIGSNVVDTCVRRDGVFTIRKNEEKAIMEDLLNENTTEDRDPRKILHCFYRLFREGKRPSYATAIQSLAFNQYWERKRRRKG